MIFHRLTTIPLFSSLFLMLALTGCSSSSSGGGVFGQTFNVSGQWSGTITETTGVARAATVTFADSGGTVTGTISVVGHTCFSGGNLTGTSSQAPANTTDAKFICNNTQFARFINHGLGGLCIIPSITPNENTRIKRTTTDDRCASPATGWE